MTARYDRTSIALHWASAFLVLWQWGQAHVIDLVTTGGTPGRRAMISLHVLGGVLLLGVLLYRLFWRHTGGARLPQPAGLLFGRILPREEGRPKEIGVALGDDIFLGIEEDEVDAHGPR